MSSFSRLTNIDPTRSKMGTILVEPIAASGPHHQPMTPPATMATRIGRTGADFASVPAAPMRRLLEDLGVLDDLRFALGLGDVGSHVASRHPLQQRGVLLLDEL